MGQEILESRARLPAERGVRHLIQRISDYAHQPTSELSVPFIPPTSASAPGVNSKSLKENPTLNVDTSPPWYWNYRPSILLKNMDVSVMTEPLYLSSPVRHFIVSLYPLSTFVTFEFASTNAFRAA